MSSKGAALKRVGWGKSRFLDLILQAERSLEGPRGEGTAGTDSFQGREAGGSDDNNNSKMMMMTIATAAGYVY